MKLYLHESALSDGGLVYNLTVGKGAYLEAVTFRDAMTLIDKIRAAIEAHTNSKLEVVELSEPYRYGHNGAQLVDGQRIAASSYLPLDPTHADGSRKKIQEMTSDERREVFRRACSKLKAEFEHPEFRAEVARILRSPAP